MFSCFTFYHVNPATFGPPAVSVGLSARGKVMTDGIKQLIVRLRADIETVHYCQTVFGCELPSVLLATRYEKFIKKLVCTSV